MVEHPPADPEGLQLLDRVCRRGLIDLEVDAITVSMLIGRRDLTPAYASDEATGRFQHSTALLGEGPSFDAVETHTRVVVADVGAPEATSTWPVWTKAAAAAGIGAAACFPIQQGAVVAGVLTLFCDTPQTFDRERRLKAFGLADAALLALLDIAAGIAGDPVIGSGSSEALVNQVLRPQVHRAAGMVMVQSGVSIDEAMVLLRAWSFRHDRTLADVANDVVARRLRFDSEGTEGQ